MYQKNFFLRKLSIIFSIIWQFIFSLLFLIKNSSKYSLLHTFGNTWSIGIFTLYFYLKKKVVIRELVTDLKNPFYPIQIDFLVKNVFQKKNLIVAISHKLKILCEKNNVNCIWQRPNPINEKKFYVDFKNKYKFRKIYSKFNKKDIVLCSIGSLVKSKNHTFLLDVLKYLPNNFKLIIIGPENQSDIDYFENLKKKCSILKLEHRVQLEKRFLKNIEKYIKLSDVYLFPSKREGLGTPVLEAQACGVPVVSNFLKDITDKEIVTSKGGYCSSLDPKIFAKKIKLSLKIKKEILVTNAKFINKRASSKIIDREYFKRIKNLLNQ